MLEIPYNNGSTREKVTIFIRYSGLKRMGIFRSIRFLLSG
jgi:hypothetical protein